MIVVDVLLSEQECAQVCNGHTKSCLACNKAKQRCLGAVWEHGEGVSGEASGAAVRDVEGIAVMLKEMVAGQKILVKKIRNLGEMAEGIYWGWGPVQYAKEYTKWLEELEKELNELELEQLEYREFLRGLGEKQDEELAVVEGEGEKNN